MLKILIGALWLIPSGTWAGGLEKLRQEGNWFDSYASQPVPVTVALSAEQEEGRLGLTQIEQRQRGAGRWLRLGREEYLFYILFDDQGNRRLGYSRNYGSSTEYSWEFQRLETGVYSWNFGAGEFFDIRKERIEPNALITFTPFKQPAPAVQLQLQDLYWNLQSKATPLHFGSRDYRIYYSQDRFTDTLSVFWPEGWDFRVWTYTKEELKKQIWWFAENDKGRDFGIRLVDDDIVTYSRPAQHPQP